MSKYIKLLCIIFFLSSEIILPQCKDCFLNFGFWTPELNSPPQKINVRLNNFNYILNYRYHINGIENKIYIESIESSNTEDINLTIKSFGNLNLFFNYLIIEFLKKQNSICNSCYILEDSNLAFTIDIIKNINWKIINNKSTSNEVKQLIIPCSTDICFNTNLTINHSNDNIKITLLEYEINPELNYYGTSDIFPNCISIIQFNPPK